VAYEFLVKELQPSTVLHTRVITSAVRVGDAIESALDDLYGSAARAGLDPDGPPEVAYLTDFVPGTDAETEIDVIIPVSGEALPGARMLGELATRPSRRVASTIHYGRYETLHQAYRKLYDWVREAGYTVAGAPSEIYVLSHDEESDPDKFQTEVVVPVDV
jgi:effector-binding domain-containing protein